MTLQKRAIIHILSIFFLALVCFPVTALAAPEKKLDFLVRFFDLNERAFAYHRHCLSQKEVINPDFLRTLELVADGLLAESKIDSPNLKLEYIRARILERRYHIQYRLDRANMSDRCYSEEALKSKAHYLEFSRYNKPEIRKFIDKETYD